MPFGINNIIQMNISLNNQHIDQVMIDIGISSMKGSEEFTYICLLTMIKLAKNPDRLVFHLGIDLNQSKIKSANIHKIITLIPNINIHYISTGYPRSSISHATVINKLYSHFTHSFVIISDNDLAIYQQNWDSSLIQTMLDKQVPILGIPYDNIINKDNYQNFPCATFCMLYQPVILPLKLNFLPFNWNDSTPIRPIIVTDLRICKICNIPVGSKMKFDTGSDLYLKIKEANLPHFTMSKEKDKFSFNLNDKLFLSHYRKGSKKLNGTKDSLKQLISWTNSINSHVLKSYNINLSPFLL